MRKYSDNEKAESSVRLDFPMGSQGEVIEIRESPASGSHIDSEVRPTGLQTQASGMKAAAPEKKIMVFAIRLALLEKAASGLGTLAFVWATVVLLGGFAIKLEREDFWLVTIILVIEGTRIFSRSRELEWQHETTLTMAEFKEDAKQASFRILNAGRSFFDSVRDKLFSARNVALQKGRSEWGRARGRQILKRGNLPGPDNPFVQFAFSQNVSLLLFWAQLLSASTCIALSVWRLVGQHYGHVEGNGEKENRNPALNVFYGLAVAEAFLFLVEKAYWQWEIQLRKLLVRVKDEFGLEDNDVPTLQRFFYDTYSRCINGSVFDGLKMDMLCFSVELLKSTTDNGQLSGARVLSALVHDSRFSEEMLRSVGIMQDVVERLLEMLNWKNRHEQEVRQAVAEIVCSFVKKNRNSLRVAQIPGAVESIASLLYDSTRSNELRDYDYSGFSLLGLRILKNLATDHGNCAKIGSTEALLPKIIRFTDLHTANLSKARIKTLRLSLRLLKMLAACKGESGNLLRKEILKNVFTISNLREFLLYEGSDRLQLQILAIETLTSLALEEEGRQSIGSTGGVLSNLFSVFFMDRINTNEDDETRQLVSKAGEALTLLTLHNSHNCEAMVKLKLTRHQRQNGNVIRDLIGALSDPLQGVHAARILRNLCAFCDQTDCHELREITNAATEVLKLVMEEEGELEEAAIGLAAQILKLFNKSSMDNVFNEAGINRRMFVMRLTDVLRRHPRPSIKVPYIRRFCIEVVICMVEKEKGCFATERLELEEAFVRVEETTSELESYSRLSGGIGLTRHHISIHSLVNTALSLLSS